MPIPTKDQAAIGIMIRHLERKPRTVEELAKLMRITVRTVYRWLRFIEDEGRDVVSRRNKKRPGKKYYSVLPLEPEEA